MVTLALLQGVLNTFVIFLARIIGGIVDPGDSAQRPAGLASDFSDHHGSAVRTGHFSRA